MIRQLLANAPTAQVVRYLFVGAWNTLFGYGVFALLTYLLYARIAYSYMVASVISNILAITIAYVNYKFFVFKTKGNYLREYLRFYAVYGVAAAINLALLPILVTVLNLLGIREIHSPFLAGALLTFVTVVLSFLGHRNFSFKPQPNSPDGRLFDSQTDHA